MRVSFSCDKNHTKQKCFNCGETPRPGCVCDECRAALLRQDHNMTRDEAAKLCKRIARTHGVPCRVLVADREGEQQLREIGTWVGGVPNGLRRLRECEAFTEGFDDCKAWHWPDSPPCFIAVAFFQRDTFRLDDSVEKCRAVMCRWLLLRMLHEIAHHYKRQARHGKRWRRCFEYLKTQWGVS